MKRTPLPATLLLAGIFGFIAALLYTWNGALNPTWGTTFMIFFLILFLASIVSIAPRADEL